MTIEELIERSHKLAVDMGWWKCAACGGDGYYKGPRLGDEPCPQCNGTGESRPVVDQVNDFHEAIGRAWREYRAGRMETWYSCNGESFTAFDSGSVKDRNGRFVDKHSGMKPEGFWVEIADLCIRLADTMGAYGWKYRGGCFDDSFCTSPPAFLIKHLHNLVDRMQHHYYDYWIDLGGCGLIGRDFASRAIQFAVRGAWKGGIDLLALCELKMAYNATRPHRHERKPA